MTKESSDEVTLEQFHVITREIEDLKSQLTTQNKGWQWWTQLVISVLVVTMTAVVVPWGTWTTKQIQEVSSRLGKLEEWKSIGPRFTSIDAENLRLKILQEAAKDSAMNFGERIGRIDAKMDKLSDTITTLSISIQSHQQRTP
jgi:hypothetical protein